MLPVFIVVLGMFTEAVTVVGAPDEDEHIVEIGISKIGIDVVSPPTDGVGAPLLLVLLLLLFFFFDPPLLVPVVEDLPSLEVVLVGGGGSPAATACAFISFCRFSACDLACLRK